MTPKYYLAYLTANDDDYFFIDYLHSVHLSKFDPGVEFVTIYIAVSEVKQKSDKNQACLNKIISIIERNPKLKVESVVYKSNIGRDFSSAATCLRAIATKAQDADFILFTNRSAYGPLKNNWYSDYLKQYNAHKNIGLCGSTINFASKAAGLQGCENVHVQTYIYLSTLKTSKTIIEDFPGEHVVERPQLLEEGELGLSKQIINNGFYITALFTSKYRFNHQSTIPDDLSTKDIKGNAKGLPYLYKFKSYEKGLLGLFKKFKWRFLLYKG